MNELGENILKQTDARMNTIPHKALAKSIFLYSTICHLLPLLGTVAAVAMLPWLQPTTAVILVALIMWGLTFGIGISVGFHRLFSHRSFVAKRGVREVIAVLGTMAGQGPLIAWVALHRRHHQFSDEDGDPHSPWNDGEKPIEGWSGFWHSHFGWVFTYDMPNPMFYAPDLLKDPAINFINRTFLVWFAVGLLLPGAVSGLVEGSWSSFVLGVLWAGFVRVVVSSQLTWSINSICHLTGNQAHATQDQSRNIAALALATFGESWHNNHHASPHSARFGTEWWQVDLGYMTIRLLKLIGAAEAIHTTRPRKD